MPQSPRTDGFSRVPDYPRSGEVDIYVLSDSASERGNSRIDVNPHTAPHRGDCIKTFYRLPVLAPRRGAGTTQEPRGYC